MVRWATDVNGVQFGFDVYGKNHNLADCYITEKFQLMQNNFIMFLAGLDENNLNRLLNSIDSRNEINFITGFRKGVDIDYAISNNMIITKGGK
jgi:hypothetical protein